MAGYYVPSSFSANYVGNKKNEDGTNVYDSARNSVGIDAQRNLQQLNKQYNVTINQAHAGNLLANRGLRASTLGTGYKQAYAEQLQASVNNEINQAGLSVADAKQNIFNNLAGNLNQINMAQQQEMTNMGHMASTLEQYYGYVQGLTDEGMNKYTDTNKFDMSAGSTFEDNYTNLFSMNKGTVANYFDENNNPALAYEDWLRQNEKDTNWLDWAYGGGMTQYQDFIKNGVHSIYPEFKYAPPVKAEAEEAAAKSGKKKTWWQNVLTQYAGGS